MGAGEMPSEKFPDMTGHQNALKVSWGRDASYVQVGAYDSEADHDTGDPAYGRYVHLNRDAINALIRTLRKARDQAYGADA